MGKPKTKTAMEGAAGITRDVPDYASKIEPMATASWDVLSR